MSLQSSFTQKSIDERLILTELIPLIYDSKYKIEYYFTDTEGIDIYDAYIMILDERGTPIKRFMLEIKIRDTHYPELLLEKEKLDNLNKKAKESDAEVIYISTTPEGSYMFRMKNFEDKILWKREEHWKSTTDKSKGKKTKSVTYLDCDLAKYYPIKQTDLPKIKYRIEETKKVVETTKKHQRTRCLFEALLNMKPNI